MSIFKESFRGFVRKQLSLREKILSIGNNGEKRTAKQIVDISDVGGPSSLEVPSNAFFTNTVQRYCNIRMSSGADITEEAAKMLATEGPYFKAKHIKGSGLARRYILQGGTLTVDRETLEHKDESTHKITEPKGEEAGHIETTRVRKEKYKWRLGKRSGFAGASRNRFGTAYGDPTIRSNPGEGFGNVPMPGITKANIKTKTAYGSIREAKVEFVCHNQRQLECLELLYMRPGVPVLLEWGWTSYIGNDGKRENDFPFNGNFWVHEYPMAALQQEIIQQKIDTSGNYDGIVGMIKNFTYSARPDGGYNCETELIGMGELIESIKGNKTTIGQKDNSYKTVDTFELGLECFIMYCVAYKHNFKSGGEERTDTGKFIKLLYMSTPFGLAFNNKEVNELRTYIEYAENTNPFLEKCMGIFNAQAKGDLNEGVEFFDIFGLNDEDADGNLINVPEGSSKTEELRKLILVQDIGDENQQAFDQPYIRWDALCYFMNKYCVEHDALGRPLIELTTFQLINEGDDDEKLEPLLYCKIPDFTVPRKNNESGAVTYTDTVDMKYGGQNFGFFLKHQDMSGNLTQGSMKIGHLLDMCVDPNVALMPTQVLDRYKKGHSSFRKTYTLTFGAATWLLGGATSGFGFKNAGNKIKGAAESVVKETMKGNQISSNEIEASKDKYFRSIGNIYFSLSNLIRKFKRARYDGETGEPNADFNLHTFLQDLWDDVNRLTGNFHNFKFHVDKDRPHVCRIVDLNFQKDEELTKEKLHVLKIQSNDTTTRDFAYNSTIPSSLSTTIATAVQNPDNINDLDNASFAALGKMIKSRFNTKEEDPASLKEEDPPSKEEREGRATIYDQLVTEIHTTAYELLYHRALIIAGFFSKVDEDTGESTKAEEIGQAVGKLEKLYTLSLKEQALYNQNGEDENGRKFYKGYRKKLVDPPPVSSIIPLKFTSKMDGISGIVIGNVFRVDETRLPKMYKNANVAFVCTSEQQQINTNGDWTTEIGGQIVILPSDIAPTQDTEIKSTNVSKVVTNAVKKIKEVVEKVINKQDECPEGYYYSEEEQKCVPEEPAQIKIEVLPSKATNQHKFSNPEPAAGENAIQLTPPPKLRYASIKKTGQGGEELLITNTDETLIAGIVKTQTDNEPNLNVIYTEDPVTFQFEGFNLEYSTEQLPNGVNFVNAKNNDTGEELNMSGIIGKFTDSEGNQTLYIFSKKPDPPFELVYKFSHNAIKVFKKEPTPNFDPNYRINADELYRFEGHEGNEAGIIAGFSKNGTNNPDNNGSAWANLAPEAYEDYIHYVLKQIRQRTGNSGDIHSGTVGGDYEGKIKKALDEEYVFWVQEEQQFYED